MLRSWEVQKAIYAALTGDATLMGMVTGVFDQPGQNQAFPYITLGEDTNVPDDLLVATGSQNTHTIHTWSRAAGMSQIKQIMDRVYFVLHRKQLTVATTQAFECAIEFSETFRDADGQTRHGVQRCRVKTFG
jgi:hypothetical protein